ncbi:Lsr2 family protein [Streptomyces sp. NPDC088360]|uniref:histone-like nucleoid-structuring protein Lsr2 n=1 Tax=Streptomyces sp. NPDC088360 TaxID=3154515 RepID=UPI00344E1F1F
MAQKVRVRLVDDLDGCEAQETVSFTFDGKPREIELSHENAAKFRAFMAPYMEASRPAKPTNLAAKGAPAPTQAQLREDGVAIRAWAAKYHLPVNPRGRIPENTRKAWTLHTKHNDRSLLDTLLERAGIDPSTVSDAEPDNVVRISAGKETVQDRHERLARTVGKLSGPQQDRLLAACAGDGTARAEDSNDRSSYIALVRRGCMMHDQANDIYTVTEVGRTWVRMNKPRMTA